MNVSIGQNYLNKKKTQFSIYSSSPLKRGRNNKNNFAQKFLSLFVDKINKNLTFSVIVSATQKFRGPNEKCASWLWKFIRHQNFFVFWFFQPEKTKIFPFNCS